MQFQKSTTLYHFSSPVIDVLLMLIYQVLEKLLDSCFWVGVDSCVLKVKFKDVALLRVVLYDVHDDVVDVFLFILDVDDCFFLQLHFLAVDKFLAVVEEDLFLNIYVGELMYFCSNLLHAVVSR